MYSDLFDQLGGRGAGGGNRSSSENNTSSSSRAAQGPPPLVALKAGKLTLTPSSTTTESSSSYRCVADPRRGEIRLVYQADAGGLTWQWYDRRDETVVDTYPLSTTTSSYGSLDRVPLTGKRHERDRIYVWSRPQEEPPEATTNTTPAMDYDMYWMQDESTEQEDALIQELNSYLANPAKAAANNSNSNTAPGTTSTTTTGSGAAATTNTGNAATSTNNNNNTSTNTNSLQVDALSTILENLGMPQPTAGGTSNTAASGTGTLTLADLQGAMAQMQQQPSSQSSPPVAIPLTEVVTPAAITALLESDDPTVRQRLAALLPSSSGDGNNSSEQTLADNLRSPQVQQTLRSLTQALLPDDHGNVDGFLSVLANFQLNGNNNNNNLTPQAMANPIQAFLDAIQESVQDNTSTNTEPAADMEGGESKEEEEKSEDPMDEGN